MKSRNYWQKTPYIVGPAFVGEFDKIGQKETRVAIELFILEQSTENSTLLDAGCNTGVEAHRLHTVGYKGKYVGVDSNKKAIEHALHNMSGKINYSFVISDLKKLPFPDKQFDIVLNKDVIEHLPQFKPVLRELLRVSKDIFILSMFITCTDNPPVVNKHPEGYYLNTYNRHELYSFIEMNGFTFQKILFADQQDEVILFRRTSTV